MVQSLVIYISNIDKQLATLNIYTNIRHKFPHLPIKNYSFS
jgi:hypothetical protein